MCLMLKCFVFPTKSGSHKVFLSNLTSVWLGWPVHDLWHHQCTIHRSRVRLTKFGCYTAFLSNLPPGWPQLTPDDFWSQACISFPSGVLTTKLGGHRPFLSKPHRLLLNQFDLYMTVGRVALKISSEPQRYTIEHSWAIWPWLTPVGPYLTFDPRNALHLGSVRSLRKVDYKSREPISTSKFASKLYGKHSRVHKQTQPQTNSVSI